MHKTLHTNSSTLTQHFSGDRPPRGPSDEVARRQIQSEARCSKYCSVDSDLENKFAPTALAGSSPISLEAPTDPKVLPFPTEISDTLTAVHLQPCKLQLLPLFRMALPVETHIPQKPLQSGAHCVLIIQTM